jgi:hypothetical protein
MKSPLKPPNGGSATSVPPTGTGNAVIANVGARGVGLDEVVEVVLELQAPSATTPSAKHRAIAHLSFVTAENLDLTCWLIARRVSCSQTPFPVAFATKDNFCTRAKRGDL